MSELAILALDAEQITKAKTLAVRLGLDWVDKYTPQYHSYLLLSNEGLSLQTDPSMKAIQVDFLSGGLVHRCRYGGGKSQWIAKAIGLKNKAHPVVLDLTAGLGRDAYVLAHLGCKLSMIERSPIIAALLKDGLERAQAAGNTIVSNLQLIEQDAIHYLQSLKSNEKPDVIYLDPMFTIQEKSALVKKEMRILRSIVGDDLDAGHLLDAALAVGCKRVVVKRHRLAPCLNAVKPDYQLMGKSTRFDVYL